MRSEGNTQKKRRTISWFLLHDNAPSHRLVLVKDFLAKNNVKTVELPSSSPDMVAADFYLFLGLKSALKVRRWRLYDITGFIKNAIEELQSISQYGFQECFQHLFSRWQNFIVAQGLHFEGNIA